MSFCFNMESYTACHMSIVKISYVTFRALDIRLGDRALSHRYFSPFHKCSTTANVLKPDKLCGWKERLKTIFQLTELPEQIKSLFIISNAFF